MARNKTYSTGQMLFHLFMVLITGGLWLIYLFVRAVLSR